jgi:hypothetical protein
VLALPPAYVRLIGPFHRRKRRSERPFRNYSRADPAPRLSTACTDSVENQTRLGMPLRAVARAENLPVSTPVENSGDAREVPANRMKSIPCRACSEGRCRPDRRLVCSRALSGGEWRRGRKVGADERHDVRCALVRSCGQAQGSPERFGIPHVVR